MAKITFENGVAVNFQGTPTQKDIDEVWKQVSTKKTKGRLASAGSSFVGSLKSAGSKIKRANEAFSRGGNIFSNPRATMAALGAAGDVVAAPLAGLTGLAQPEIEKGVGFIAEKTPQRAKKFIGEQVSRLSPEAKQFAGDTLSATSLFMLSGLGKTAVKTGVKGAIDKAGKAVQKSGLKSASKAKTSFLDDLIRPKETVKTAAESARRSKEVGKGLLRRTVTELAPDEKSAMAALNRIKTIKPGQTAQKVLNQADDEAVRMARSLTKQLAKKDVIFPKTELKAVLKKAASRLDDNIKIGADSKSAVGKMLRKVEQMIEDSPSKGSSLLKTRKAFDKWVRQQKGDLFGGNDTTIKVANKEIRSTLNKFLIGKAKGTPVQSSLRNQSNLMNALKKLAPKAGAEAKTVISRGFQNFEKAIGKNARLKEILGGLALGTGVLSGAAPAIGVAATTGFTLKALINAAKSPATRIQLGKLLQELAKTPLTGLAATEANVLKQRIEEALKSR